MVRKRKTESLTELLRLDGRAALITGAAQGIGRAMALRFAEAGAHVILADVAEEALQATARDVAGRFPNVMVRAEVVDLAHKAAIDALWARLETAPDILVNNAGIYPFKDFLEVDAAFLRRVFAVNLEAAFWMCQHFIRRRGSQGGVILNVGSIEAFLPFMGHLAHYTTSKAGLLALTRGLARDYGRMGFRINALVPGGVQTPGTRAVRRLLLRGHWRLLFSASRFLQRVPLGRFADPDEIARMAVVLCSDLASYVHGAVVPVDGGFLSA